MATRPPPPAAALLALLALLLAAPLHSATPALAQPATSTPVPELPSVPQLLDAVPIGAERVRLRWRDDSFGELGFTIERRRDGEPWLPVGQVGPNATSYDDSGLPCGVAVEYRVRAYSAAGASDPSNSMLSAAEQIVARRYQSADTPTALGPNGGAGSLILVTDGGRVTDVDVHIDAQQHSSDNLRLWLIGPDGTRVQIREAVASAGPDFRGTILDDDAAVSIDWALPPFAGRLRPHERLSAFNERPLAGLWRLEVTNGGNFPGVLTGFGLTLSVGTGCPGLPATATPTITPTAAGSPSPTPTVTATPLPTNTGGPSSVLRVLLHPSGAQLNEGDVLTEAPSEYLLFFPEDIGHYNVRHILLLAEGPAPGFQTDRCEVQPGDTSLHAGIRGYNYPLKRLSVGYAGARQPGRYRLIVCDTVTSNYPLLDGDGDGLPGGDFVLTFSIGSTATATATSSTATSTPTVTAVSSTQTSTPSATATATMSSTVTAVATSTTIPGEPYVWLNHATGQPGSTFQLLGRGLAPGRRFTVRVSGAVVGGVAPGNDGRLALALMTSAQALSGRYTVDIVPEDTVTPMRSFTVLLGWAYPRRELDGATGETASISPAIYPSTALRLYLPILPVSSR